jgi:hypothetical protein
VLAGAALVHQILHLRAREPAAAAIGQQEHREFFSKN